MRKHPSIVTRVREEVLVTSRLYSCPIRPAEGAANPPAEPFVIRRATDADLARMASDLGGELTPAKATAIRARHARTDMEVFVAALPDGEVGGYGHTQYGWIDDAHYALDLGAFPGVAHLFDDYVASAYRGRGLQAALIRARLAAARARGSRRATILVADSNHASRASVRRSGFTPALRVITLRAGRRRLSRAIGSTRPLSGQGSS